MPLIPLTYALPYALRARALRRAGRPLPWWRVASFAAGLALLAVAVSGPVGRLADRRFAGHMAEHLAIGDLAPLLIVLGCSGPVLAPVLRLSVARVWRRAGHPVAAIALWVTALYAWHLPGPYDLALRNDAVHVVQHGCFFVAGLVLWGALLGPLPKPAWFGAPARLGYITAVWLLGGPLGAALAFSDTPFYGRYGGQGAAATLADQSVGGALMLVEGTTVAVVLFCWQFLRIFDDARERQELTELATAGGVALDPTRVARAVDARAHEALRRRILEQEPRA